MRKMLFLFGLVLIPTFVFAVSPEDSSDLKSCSGKEKFFCSYLESDMNSCVLDISPTIEHLTDFNNQASGHEKDVSSYILYTHIQAYTILADNEDSLVTDFDKDTDELVNKYVEMGGSREAGDTYRNDIKIVKKYCADKFKKSTQKLRDLVPASLQKEYDKQINNKSSTYKWLSMEESANHTERGFFGRLFSLIAFKLKGLFK